MINLFFSFMNTILSFEFLGISLINYLIAAAILIFVFKIIGILGNIP